MVIFHSYVKLPEGDFGFALEHLKTRSDQMCGLGWFITLAHPPSLLKFSSNPHLPSGELTCCNGKSPFLMGKSTISMAIFNCYVSSPEGNDLKFLLLTWPMLAEELPVSTIDGFSHRLPTCHHPQVITMFDGWDSNHPHMVGLWHWPG